MTRDDYLALLQRALSTPHGVALEFGDWVKAERARRRIYSLRDALRRSGDRRTAPPTRVGYPRGTQRQDARHAAPHNAQHLADDKRAAARKCRVSRPLLYVTSSTTGPLPIDDTRSGIALEHSYMSGKAPCRIIANLSDKHGPRLASGRLSAWNRLLHR